MKIIEPLKLPKKIRPDLLIIDDFGVWELSQDHQCQNTGGVAGIIYSFYFWKLRTGQTGSYFLSDIYGRIVNQKTS